MCVCLVLCRALRSSGPDTLELFNAIDTDGSGSISPTELLQGLQMIGEADVTEAEVKEIFALIDEDGDGTLDYDEISRVGKMSEELKSVSRKLATLDAAVQSVRQQQQQHQQQQHQHQRSRQEDAVASDNPASESPTVWDSTTTTTVPETTPGVIVPKRTATAAAVLEVTKMPDARTMNEHAGDGSLATPLREQEAKLPPAVVRPGAEEHDQNLEEQGISGAIAAKDCAHEVDQTATARRDAQEASATLEPATGGNSPDAATGSMEDDKSAEQRGGLAE